MWHKTKKKFKESQICSCCGQAIASELPALAFGSPAYWDESFVNQPGNHLTTDFCQINDEAFFVRCVLRIPIMSSDQVLEWGVWVSVSEANFQKYQKVFGTRKERKEEPYFGWLSNELPGYKNCLSIKTNIHLQGGGMRPLVELDHEDNHSLCQHQHGGITMKQAHQYILKALG